MSFKFSFTKEKLAKIIKRNPHWEQWFLALDEILPEYDIDTVKRVAAFLAQCAHESAEFTAMRENLNYSAAALTKIWPRRFPADVAARYARRPEAIANRAYADRMGNGSEDSGDGWRYRGRGLIQLTGRANYQQFADSIETSIDEIPAYLETFQGAVQSACWFWDTNNLNPLADAGDIRTLTRRINGGFIGLDDRIRHYHHALEVLS
jgi:putative chitinase